MTAKGEALWTFSAADDPASVRAIEAAGFEKRYSLTRRRAAGWPIVSKRIDNPVPAREADLAKSR